MLDVQKISERASKILQKHGHDSKLSPQAMAVIQAIVEASNSNGLLVSQALINRFDKQIDAVKQTKSGKMKRPTIEEVQKHGEIMMLPRIECEKFFHFYESKGWKVGDQPMKLWTAAMANWKRTWQQKSGLVKNSLSVQLKSTPPPKLNGSPTPDETLKQFAAQTSEQRKNL